MFQRNFCLGLLLLLPSLAVAQTVTEPGWTPLYSESSSNTAAVAIGPDGVVYWGPADGALVDEGRKPIRSRKPTGVGTGSVKTLHDTAGVSGLAFAGTQLHFTTSSTDNMQRLVPGQVAGVFAAGFPGADPDDPAGIEAVPTAWIGGSIVSANELLVPDSGSPDVLYAINGAGTARTLTADPVGTQTFVDVAVSPTLILIADRQNDAIFRMNSQTGPGPVATSALTISPALGAAPVGIEWDPTTFSPALESFVVALANGTLVRLTAPVVGGPGGTWTKSTIGTGFSFHASATQVLDMSSDGATLVVAGTSAIAAFARCTLASAPDCNGNSVADVCDRLVSGGAELPDCNGNDTPDSCDIASATSSDCDGNDVPDECAACATPVDVVFNVDTSGSMNDEALVLCQNMASIVSDLDAEGITIHPTLLAVGVDTDSSYTNDPDFSCLTNDVGTAVGVDVPGDPPDSVGGQDQGTLYGDCGGPNATANEEDWGRATSVLATGFPWSPGDIRLVVNLTDEGPWCGSAVDEADSDSVAWAIQTATGNVIVSTALASGYYNAANTFTEDLAVDLANGTGGTVTRELSGPDLVEAIKGIVRDACVVQNDCNGDTISDVCQLAGDDCNNDGRLDSCAGTTCDPPACSAAPLATCIAPSKASLLVKESVAGKEQWKLALDKFVSPVAQNQFGDPVTGSTVYRVCLYNDASTLVGTLEVNRAGQDCGTPSKPCWKAASTKGYKYKDKSAAADGMLGITGTGGAALKGKLSVKAANKAAAGHTSLPTGIAAQLLNDAAATVQVVTSDASCFGVTLSNVKKADGSVFLATTP